MFRHELAAFSPRGLDLASSVIKVALRGDARRGPASRGEVKRASSRWTQIAQQNCSTGERTSAGGSSASARPASEHAIWQSEVSLKGVAGGLASGTRRQTTRHVYFGSSLALT
jgi:hypothetical protein